MIEEREAPLLLEMRGIRKTFPGVIALENVDFELRRGEVHILLGENGAGKSTLIKILSGAHRCDQGTIRLAGEEVDIEGPRHSQQLGISVIYQEFNLVTQLSVAENIYLGREPCRVPGWIDRRKMISDAARQLTGLGMELDPDTSVSALGVAEKQMVEVAKALSLQCRILILDEPTSALTESEIRQLFSAIRRLKESGVALIYISHRLEELYEIGERVTVLRDGKNVATRPIQEVSRDELVRLMANRDLKEHYPRKATAAGPEVLKVRSLSSSKRLKGISLSLRSGEILGIFGLLGAGRTELARVLFGGDSIDSGEIMIEGRPRKVRSPVQGIRLGLGLLPEDRKHQGLVLNLSVAENIALPSLFRLSRFGVVNSSSVRELVSRFVRELNIRTPGLQQKVIHLSGGNQQKVVLSKWLGAQARILIFDEPTRGIDVASKVEIYQLMNRLTAGGAAILMISSELPEILGMSDRILVMHQGKISGRFERGKVNQEMLLNAALGHPAGSETPLSNHLGSNRPKVE